MKSVKGHQEEEEEEYDDFGSSKKDVTTSTNSRDGKNSDKANAMRSKHSVTEQRRRSKINERHKNGRMKRYPDFTDATCHAIFQILRDLIPNSDQKRDTASFLLEVIEYVQYLQEKVQKYEGSYQGWNPEPTKLMPWRNSHWRVQSFAGQAQAIKNDSGPASTFPVRFDENNVAITPTMQAASQNPVDSDPSMDASFKAIDQQPELGNKTMVMPMPSQASMPPPVQTDSVFTPPLRPPVSDAQSTEVPITSDSFSQQEELTIEGGTISISSVYSQELLNTLTAALHNAGVDLSQATISVQVDLGKRANRGLTSSLPIAKDHENPHSSNPPVGHFGNSSNEDSNQAQKRPKI
ncbi:hypothetical protein RJ639_027087 [Escallonia herrerae]|uniref:BHLH domain-containing protein n=1 Tax=Escallonia herrerae TaxID=1293975 RepID=A0AA88X5I7_9ASTE|nr:hypothetical protein RJ639_027087 [Escallonia herrerae]